MKYAYITAAMYTYLSHNDYSKSSTSFIARLWSEARKGNYPFSFREEPFALLSYVKETYPNEAGRPPPSAYAFFANDYLAETWGLVSIGT